MSRSVRDEIAYLVVIVLVIIVVVIVQVVVDVVGDVDDRVGDGDHEREEGPGGEPAPGHAVGLGARQLLLEHHRHFCRGRAPGRNVARGGVGGRLNCS